MEFDLGLTALGVLAVLSIGFGALAYLVGKPGSRWEFPIAVAGYFAGGLFVSEVMFAGATEDELQPIIDGLAFDEALLGGLVVGLVVAFVTRRLTRGSPFRRTASA
jgi:hypothetical protein